MRESKTNASKETKHYYCNQLLLSGQQQNTLHNFAIVPIASQYRKFGRSPILSQRIVVVGTCLCNSVAARRKDDAEWCMTSLAADFADGTEFQRISCDNNDNNNFCLTDWLQFADYCYCCEPTEANIYRPRYSSSGVQKGTVRQQL